MEIEEFKPDLSSYKFVTLQGQIVEVTDPSEKERVRKMFADMIKEKGLSRKVLKALGHSPEDPLACLVKMERSYVWKLVDVVDITSIVENKPKKGGIPPTVLSHQVNNKIGPTC
ncbi:hypothetical protein MTTB_03150 [Methanothermobacter tenebrarum]|uniref:Uncharacterized protein n=1 Tax=Methanothermobacter tenebrarum TaxID=680118 RepID=A0ABN6PE84_9EURY|nr:hypothetical protein MTTB_03150 [Methanothermobacter tenebrarum]